MRTSVILLALLATNVMASTPTMLCQIYLDSNAHFFNLSSFQQKENIVDQIDATTTFSYNYCTKAKAPEGCPEAGAFGYL